MAIRGEAMFIVKFGSAAAMLAASAPAVANGWPFGGLVLMSAGCGRHIVIATPEGDTIARVVGGQIPKAGDELDGDFHHIGSMAVSLPRGGVAYLQIEAVDLSSGQSIAASRQACERAYSHTK